MHALRNLGPTRLTIRGIVVFAMIGFFIYLTSRLTAPQLVLLYGNLESGDASAISNQLSTMNIPFEMKNNGTEVHVAQAKASTARLAMAEKGLPSGGSFGYDIFDKQSGLGTTNFQQNVNLLRAMEGELAETIATIESVRSARVHLVLPKREMFQREKSLPSASIFLRMKGGVRLESPQVTALRHLVAAAVPGLMPTSISVVDGKGELLARGYEGDPGSTEMIAKRSDDRRQAYERRLSQSVEKLIEKSIGFGKVRAEVNAEMDFDQISTNEESFDPDGQVVRSTQSVEQTVSSQDKEPAAVTVGNNLPDVGLGGDSAASRNAAESRTEETVNFEISKKVTNQVRDTGIINRLSVAVLVDGAYALNEDTDEVDYKARTPEEMKMLTALVRGAIGYSADRGDVVEVINMRFADYEPEPEAPLDLFFGFEKNDLLKIAEMLVLTILAMLVVRPLISRAFEALPGAASALAEGGRLIADQAQLAAGALAAPPGADGDDEDEMFDELIDIDRVEGRVKASSVKKVGEIVEKHPDEALSIVRNWLYQEST